MVGGPGGDLLSHVLRRSTIGAEGFHGRVRDGIGCGPLAMTTRSTNRPRGRRLTPLRVFEDFRGLGAMRLTDACAVLVSVSSCGLAAARDVFAGDQADRAISKA